MFAICCTIELEGCMPQRVRVARTCDSELSYYWLGGSGCAAIRACACEGSDCDEGFATEDECMAAFEGCEHAHRVCDQTPGGACKAGEFCFEPTCEQTSFGGVCFPIPEACDDTLEPVCGCDGVTYDNQCKLDQAGLSVRSYSACDAASEP